jgi:hypothetical protein
VGDAALGGAEDEVGHAAALGARQPRRHEGVGGVELRVDPHRAPGEEDRDHRDPGRLQPLQELEVVRPEEAVVEGLAIPWNSA